MATEVSLSYNLESAARTRLEGLDLHMQFDVDIHTPVPMVGDYFSVEGAPEMVFVIARRHFHWLTETHLQIGLTLGLPA